MNGRQVRLYLADGTPGGLLTAEIMNWTGHVVAAPRSDLADLLKRPEVSRTGVYLLLGDDPDNAGSQQVYIGEGDDVGKRLYQHGRDETKGFWDRAIVLTSKDMNLTKAHARYLESRFIALATDAGRARLANVTAPPEPGLPEADKSDMEYFIAQAKIVLPVLGINVLRSTAPEHATSGVPVRPEPPTFVITQPRDKVLGRAQEVDGEFTVRAGSRARRHWTSKGAHGYSSLRARLEADGSLVPSDDNATMVFVRDQVFASPSAAAAVMLGRPSNGRLEWRVEGGGASYGDWQTTLLEGLGR